MAMLLMMAFSILSIVSALLIKFMLKKDNKKILAEAERTAREVKLYTEWCGFFLARRSQVCVPTISWRSLS